MGPKLQTPQSGDLFRFPLAEHLNPKHELVLLGDAMDWSEIERSFSAHFASTTGRPALPPRLVAGRQYLQHAYNCSDEIAVNTWVENPYWQFFTGETYVQIESPIDPSSLTRWRTRIGEEGVAFTVRFEPVVQGLLDHTNLAGHFGRAAPRIDQLRSRRRLELLGISRLRNPLHRSPPVSPFFALPSVSENRRKTHRF